MVYVVNGVLASDVDMVLEKDFVGFTLQDMKIHPLMLLIRTLSMILQTFSPTLHNPSTNHTCVNYVEMTLIMVIIVHHGYRFLRDISIYDDDDNEESTIPLNEIISQIHPSIAITTVLPTIELEDSLIMEDKHLSTIPEKESGEVIKSSVEDFVPIPSESEDTSGSDSDCDLPSCNDFSPINISEEKSVTFSNPLFDSNEDFISSDDESLSDKDVLEDNVKIYSNLIFEFNDEYISSDINPLFDEVLEDIESNDSYVSNLDEPALLVTPFSDANTNECFDLGGNIDKIDAFLDIDVSTDIEDDYCDSEGDIIYRESLLIKDTTPSLPPKEFLDYDPRSLKDEPDNDDLITEDKVFDPEIHEKKISPTYESLPFKDRDYLSLTYVIRIFLPYFIYPVEFTFLLSPGSEDNIFDPGISAFHFSSLEPVESHPSGTFMRFNVYPNILNEIITKYLVNISKRRAFWSLNEEILKIYYSDNQYAISIKEDTAYPCLHSPKTTKETCSIHRIQRSPIHGIQDIRRKTTTQDAQNDDTSVHTEEPQEVNHDKPVESNEALTNDQPQITSEPVAQPSNRTQTLPIPFPRRLRKEKEEAQQKKFLENLKQLQINLPFIEALAQMPKYAKFLKGLLTNKARLEEACTITMNERCSAVLLNKLPSKEKDPRSFTIPCNIGQLRINNALADLGASISLMPYTRYEKLGLGEPKATRMSLELADRSIQYPRGIIENVLIKVDKFVLPIDFVILDMPEDSRVPIILGRPFFATARAMIDVFNKKITLRVGEDEVIFDVDQSIKRPLTEDDESSANEIDEKKPEMKDLPNHLEYAYLHGDKSFPIIISSKLSDKEKTLLLKVLEKRKGAIAWKMTDIKGISPSYCTHKILMEDDFKQVIQPQRRLNRKVQDVVKNKIVKLLYSSLIYPISDSSWVSHVHVVPKKGGMTVVLNDNNELIPSRTVTG
ncbi:DNA-directed DNA polymerase [Tanacetum coccineum]